MERGINNLPRGCLKSRNPLTGKVAKELRKDRKELINSGLTLRALRILGVLCG